MSKSKAPLCAIILIVERVFNSHLSMEPPEDRYKKVHIIKAIVVFTVKVLKTAQMGNSELVTSPDNSLTVAHLPLSMEGATL